MKPIISIITLTYKNYTKLYETIKSVLEQDYPRLEYIIADDGSGDFPYDEVNSFIEENNHHNISYKIIVNDTNNGTVKNFNNAILNSCGDYVFPLSCNDYFIKNDVVSKIAKVFIHTNCKMVITSRIKYKNNIPVNIYPHVGDRRKVRDLDDKYKRYRALMLTEHYGMFIGCNMYYERKSLEKYGLCDEKYRLLEDLPILEKFLWNEDVELRPEIVSILYDGETGVTLKRNKVHPLLEKDINMFNQYGKIEHYNELDRKTQKHIDFGIKRSKAKSKIQLLLICVRYSPRIISYSIYNIARKITGIRDKKYLKKVIIKNTVR